MECPKWVVTIPARGSLNQLLLFALPDQGPLIKGTTHLSIPLFDIPIFLPLRDRTMELKNLTSIVIYAITWSVSAHHGPCLIYFICGGWSLKPKPRGGGWKSIWITNRLFQPNRKALPLTQWPIPRKRQIWCLKFDSKRAHSNKGKPFLYKCYCMVRRAHPKSQSSRLRKRNVNLPLLRSCTRAFSSVSYANVFLFR